MNPADGGSAATEGSLAASTGPVGSTSQAGSFLRPSPYEGWVTLRCGPAEDPDRYQLAHRAGVAGAEGQVFAAFDSLAPEGYPVVAIKVANPDLPDDEQDRLRLRWSRAAATRTDHPGLVRIQSPFLGPAPHPPAAADLATRLLYLPMDYVEGTSLADKLGTDDHNPLQILTALRPVADALDYLRDGGLVHLDVKPANIIVTSSQDGIDLGPATLVDLGALRTDTTAPSVLTPGYAAPEVLDGSAGADSLRRADVYSFAVVVARVLGVALPCARVSDDSWQTEIVSAAPGNRDLRALLAEGLRSDPDRRPPRAEDWLATVIAAVGSGHPMSVPASRRSRTRLPLRRRAKSAALLGATAVSLVAAGGFAAFLALPTSASPAGKVANPVSVDRAGAVLATVTEAARTSPASASGPVAALSRDSASAATTMTASGLQVAAKLDRQVGISSSPTPDSMRSSRIPGAVQRSSSSPARGGVTATAPSFVPATVGTAPATIANSVPASTSPAPPTSPPATSAPAHTWSETTGGVTHTWTDPTDAGGTEGASIPSQVAVQISCRLTGFAVPNDGNNWWYRIAANPWSDAYYASADAFYNNGATNGSLHGTPFVDSDVAAC